jgi:hypothetical protein
MKETSADAGTIISNIPICGADRAGISNRALDFLRLFRIGFERARVIEPLTRA